MNDPKTRVSATPMKISFAENMTLDCATGDGTKPKPRWDVHFGCWELGCEFCRSAFDLDCRTVCGSSVLPLTSAHFTV